MIPTFLVSRQVRAATVALGGDGGDELFGGYPHYRWLEKHEQMRRLLPGAPARVGSGRATSFLRCARSELPHWFRDGVAQTIAHVNLYFDEHSRTFSRRLVVCRTAPLDAAERSAPAGADRQTPLQRAEMSTSATTWSTTSW